MLTEYLPWNLAIVLIICLFGFFYTSRAHKKNHALAAQLKQQSRVIKALQDDVKVLYESANNLGVSIKKLEHGAKVLKEQQEQLTLKEPNQQAYRNAINAIENGEAISKIAETSGLSRGEVELLKMIQRFNVNSASKHEPVD